MQQMQLADFAAEVLIGIKTLVDFFFNIIIFFIWISS